MRCMHKQNYIDDTTVDAAIDGATLDISGLKGLAVHIIWTSTTAAFTVKLQQSNDEGLNWADHATTQAIANNNGNVVITYADLHAKNARVVVARTSGDLTTIKVHVSGKDK